MVQKQKPPKLPHYPRTFRSLISWAGIVGRCKWKIRQLKVKQWERRTESTETDRERERLNFRNVKREREEHEMG